MTQDHGMFEALTLARDYVESASRRMYDGTNGNGTRQEALRRLALVDAALKSAAPPAKAEASTTCNCRWDGDKQVQSCTLHEAHVDAIHEWAERAKTAEAKLAQQRNIEPPMTDAEAMKLWHADKEAHTRLTAFEWYAAGIIAGEQHHGIGIPARVDSEGGKR